MENKEELLNLISASFLPEEQKKELSDYLATNETDQNFFNKFNQYLIAEFKKINDASEEKLKLFDEKTAELDLEIEKEEKEEEEKLSEKLSNIDEMEIAKRTDIWDAYDKKLEELRVSYEKKLFAVLQELLIK